MTTEDHYAGGLPRRQPSVGTERYDVAVLGAGMVGSTLAAVLSRNGARVLLTDDGDSGAFGAEESTLPYTSLVLKVIARRYRVPEIGRLASFSRVRRQVAGSCGIKRNYGFVYHRAGRPQRPEESNQFLIPPLLDDECHYFRPDTDAYLARVAVRYGVSLRARTRVTHVDIDGAGVTLASDRGEEFRARYVVDTSQGPGPLVRRFDLTEEHERLSHHSRSLFTHMVGVRPFDEVLRHGSAYRNPSPWHDGTLHHVFDGGVLRVLPFGNRPGGTNPLCAVSLTVDPKRHGAATTEPRREFQRALDQLPAVAPQFAHATPVRDWARCERVQWSARRTVGDRFCVTAHAAGFVDTLFGQRLTHGLELVNVLGGRLLAAVHDDDFSRARFAHVERLEQSLLRSNDEMLHSSFTAFGDYPLWNAVFRVWSILWVLDTFQLECAYDRLRRAGDTGPLRAWETTRFLGTPSLTHQGADELLRTCLALCSAVAEGGTDSRTAADRVFELLRADFLPPALGLDQPDNRFFGAHPTRMAGTLRWARRNAPDDIGRVVTGALGGYLRERLAARR